jgi:hypothetical protein
LGCCWKSKGGVRELSIMPYGLRIYTAKGSITLNSSDRITRSRFGTIVASNETGSKILSDLTGHLSTEFSIKTEVGWAKVEHNVSRTGSMINWVPGTPVGATSAQSLIFCFMYT